MPVTLPVTSNLNCGIVSVVTSGGTKAQGMTFGAQFKIP
jgi:hypothetical protein